MRIIIPASCLLAAACSPQSQPSPSDAFFENMQTICDRTVEGQVISDQEVDAQWRAATLVVGPVSCESDVIRMPLAVGDDHSRTWVLSETDEGLLFRHEHIEPDGTPSPVTQYGGLAASGGTATQQAFPADASTKANFTENGIARSNTNIWTLSLEGDELRYSLARPATEAEPARDFRAVFDLSDPR